MSSRFTDYLYLMYMFLVSQDGRIAGKTRTQKMVFILERIFNVPFSFSFVLYHYGPYSFDLNSSLQTLKKLGIIKEVPELAGDYIRYEYELTEGGRQYIESRLDSIAPDVRERIRTAIEQLQTLSTDTLIIVAKRRMAA